MTTISTDHKRSLRSVDEDFIKTLKMKQNLFDFALFEEMLTYSPYCRSHRIAEYQADPVTFGMDKVSNIIFGKVHTGAVVVVGPVTSRLQL